MNAAIDQEGTMKACVEAEERKTKRVMLRPSGGSSGDALVKYRMVYTTPVGQSHQPP
jgi:hypothetical protein